MDGQGHDANQSAMLKKAARTPYELMMLDHFVDLAEERQWTQKAELLKQRMKKRIESQETVVAHMWPQWQ